MKIGTNHRLTNAHCIVNPRRAHDANSKHWILSTFRVYLAKRSTDKAVFNVFFWRYLALMGLPGSGKQAFFVLTDRQTDGYHHFSPCTSTQGNKYWGWKALGVSQVPTHISVVNTIVLLWLWTTPCVHLVLVAGNVASKIPRHGLLCDKTAATAAGNRECRILVTCKVLLAQAQWLQRYKLLG